MNNIRTMNHQDGIDLKDLLESRLAVLKTLIDANDKNYNQRFDNVLQATQSALDSSDRAVSKAEMASEKRFDAVNEFRAVLADQQRNLIPRNEVEMMMKSINDKVDSLNLSTIARQSEGVGQKQGMGAVALIAGVISVAVSILIKFIK
jgi:hypothetical protein